MGEWRKRIKEFKSQLSATDVKEFKKLKKNSIASKWYAENTEKAKQNSAKRYAKNPEKAKQNSAKWYAKNPEKAKTLNANWRNENPEKAKQSNAKQRAKNPEKAKQHNANWRAANPEHAASYINNYHKQRKAKDPLYRFQCNMRSMGNRVVRQLALGKKPASTEKWQGCTAEELKTHFESLFLEGMTWDNYGEWHVDHIRPVSSFAPEEWEQINHYTNLQPLWAKDNYSKISADLKQIRLSQVLEDRSIYHLGSRGSK